MTRFLLPSNVTEGLHSTWNARYIFHIKGFKTSWIWSSSWGLKVHLLSQPWHWKWSSSSSQLYLIGRFPRNCRPVASHFLNFLKRRALVVKPFVLFVVIRKNVGLSKRLTGISLHDDDFEEMWRDSYLHSSSDEFGLGSGVINWTRQNMQFIPERYQPILE